MRVVKGIAGVALLAVALVGIGCGSTDDDLQADQVEPALRATGYPIKLRQVERDKGTGFVGVARGPHNTRIRFSISLGEFPIRVSGKTQDLIVYHNANFTFNDNINNVRKFGNGARWDEAVSISLALQERLCRAATGDPCPI
jgi:hypothetical protein